MKSIKHSLVVKIGDVVIIFSAVVLSVLNPAVIKSVVVLSGSSVVICVVVGCGGPAVIVVRKKT